MARCCSFASLFGLILATCVGCSAFNKTSSWGDGPPPQSEPEIEDKWSSVGKEARGSRPLSDENDPLKPFLMSPEARSIERNLGYK